MKFFRPLGFALLISFFPVISFATGLGGLQETAGVAGIAQAPASPEAVAGRILAQVLSFVGVLFLCLMIWSGFLWMTSAGNEDKVKQAKAIAVSAVVGLIIVAAAYAITQFVGDSIMGTNPAL